MGLLDQLLLVALKQILCYIGTNSSIHNKKNTCNSIVISIKIIYMKRVGIILLDGSEVIIRMYEISNKGNQMLIHNESRDLTSFETGKTLKSYELIEVIAEAFFTGSSLRVTEWKICSRNVPEMTIKEVAASTNTIIENLILNREQEIMCKGLLSEF